MKNVENGRKIGRYKLVVEIPNCHKICRYKFVVEIPNCQNILFEGLPKYTKIWSFGMQIHHLATLGGGEKPDLQWIVSLGRFSGQHDAVGAVEHRVGHVRGFGPRRPRLLRHRLEHLGRADHALGRLVALGDDLDPGYDVRILERVEKKIGDFGSST
jgi:hypothetical protein